MTALIIHDIAQFAAHLAQGRAIDCNQKGEWRLEKGWVRFIRRLFEKEDDRLIRIAKGFQRALEALERTPVKFNQSQEEKQAQITYFTHFQQAGRALKEQLESCSSGMTNRCIRQLDLGLVALRYRIEKVNGGNDPITPSPEQCSGLMKLAQEWKNGYGTLYLVKKMSECEESIIRNTCRYPEFVDVLKQDPELRDLFFKWALRDACSVDAFVQFPAIATRLKNAFLAGRIGRFAEHIRLLQWCAAGEMQEKKPDSPCEKHLTLPFEVQTAQGLRVKDVSILDEMQTVNLRHDYTCSIKCIIDSIGDRNRKAGDFEMLGRMHQEGDVLLAPRIANYHSLELGPYHPMQRDYQRPDCSEQKKNWWRRISPLDTLSVDDLQRLYGMIPSSKEAWIAAVRSTREDNGKDVERSHGFLDILIPEENGGFRLYSFGKYAAHWPVTYLEKALFVTDTQYAKIESPEENHFMAQRQQAMVVTELAEQDGLQLMEEIRKDIELAQQGNLVFQSLDSNCSKWSQIKFNQAVYKTESTAPNYFRVPLLVAEPSSSFLAQAFKFCRSLAGKVREIAIRVIEFFLCSWRGCAVLEKGKKVIKRLLNSEHMEKFEIYLPAMLHERIVNRELKKGRITSGHLFQLQAYS